MQYPTVNTGNFGSAFPISGREFRIQTTKFEMLVCTSFFLVFSCADVSDVRDVSDVSDVSDVDFLCPFECGQKQTQKIKGNMGFD